MDFHIRNRPRGLDRGHRALRRDEAELAGVQIHRIAARFNAHFSFGHANNFHPPGRQADGVACGQMPQTDIEKLILDKGPDCARGGRRGLTRQQRRLNIIEINAGQRLRDVQLPRAARCRSTRFQSNTRYVVSEFCCTSKITVSAPSAWTRPLGRNIASPGLTGMR